MRGNPISTPAAELVGTSQGRGPAPRRARRRSRAGMTMVEIMIALAVLLLTLAATTTSQLSSRRLAQTAAETSTAMSDLQACMERLMLVQLDDLPLPGSAFEQAQPVAAFEGLHLDNERIVATYPDYVGGAVVPNPLEIVLTCTWRDHMGGTRALRLATVKSR